MEVHLAELFWVQLGKLTSLEPNPSGFVWTLESELFWVQYHIEADIRSQEVEITVEMEATVNWR